MLGSSSSWSTRIDWNKLMLSDKVVLAGSAGASRFVTPFRFLQWQGWLCKNRSCDELETQLKAASLPDIFHDTFSHRTRYIKPVIRWIWTSSYRHRLGFQKFRYPTMILWISRWALEIKIRMSKGSNCSYRIYLVINWTSKFINQLNALCCSVMRVAKEDSKLVKRNVKGLR